MAYRRSRLRSFARWLFLTCGALAVMAGGIWIWLATSLPKVSGTIALRGLQAPVEIDRDKDGVPHIFAGCEADAAFALGFVHAQDRLWQMEELRRLGSGRLAELVGPAGVRYDRLARTVGLDRLAEAALAGLDPAMRVALDAYTAGVNAYIRGHRGALPLEFVVLGAAPEPWHPVDSLRWGELMATRLGGHWHSQLRRALLLRWFTPEELDQIWPSYPSDGPVTLAGDSTLLRGLPLERLAEATAGFEVRGASNAWVVDGGHSETGKPILANDPHLGFSLPGIWYLATIDTPEGHLAGATVPGVPLVVLGHNDRIAWGMTTTGGDVDDLFIERMDPNDPSRYLTPEGSALFRTRRETIRVRWAAPITLQVRETRHGPVISDQAEELAKATERGTVLSLAAAWLDPANRIARALYHVDRARDWPEFVTALADFGAPEQNLVYADVDGNIGFYAAGLVPIRKTGDASVPVPGWTGEYDWAGYIPFDQLPHGLNPPSRQFINANNKVTPPGYPYPITRNGWEWPYRAERIEALLDATPRASLGGFARIQADSVSLAARDLLPMLAAVKPQSAGAERALERMRNWDGNMDRHRPEPLIFEAWLRALGGRAVAEVLGNPPREVPLPPPWVIKAVATGHPEWCAKDRGGTAADCQALATEALEAAVGWLSERYGPDPRHWRWGMAHRAEFRNHVLEHVPLIGRLFNASIPADGGNFTVNRGGFNPADEAQPFAATSGAGFRAIYDLADLRRSRFMIATGESGNPLSRHYSDLLGRWRDFDYVRLDKSREELAGQGSNRLVLTPE